MLRHGHTQNMFSCLVSKRGKVSDEKQIYILALKFDPISDNPDSTNLFRYVYTKQSVFSTHVVQR